MRTSLLPLCTLIPMSLCAHNWQVYTAAGLGQHEFMSTHETSELQAHWALYTSASSTLYDGMDGLLRLDLAGGGYRDTTIQDGDLSIDFRAHTTQSHTRLGFGLGLGVYHQKDLTTKNISNQTFIPFYADFKWTNGILIRYTASLEADVFVHLPNHQEPRSFNPMRNRFILGIHYAQQAFGCAVLYRTAQYATTDHIEGISGQRIDAVLSYTFETA